MKYLLISVAALAACSKSDSTGKPPAKRTLQFPVEVRPVEARAVDYTVDAVGTIDVFERVQITARVAGAVEKVSFREGEVVKAGQALAAIDPARFSLAAKQASAGIDSAKAALADAEAGLARREAADKTNPGLIPGEEIATWRTKVATARAALSAQEVAKQQASLDLRDAYVRAPIAGEIQTRTVETGQYVQVGTVLATMVRRDPLQLRFKVPEAEAARFTKDAAINFSVEGGARPYHAIVKHVAEVADATSRLVDVTAEIDDPDRAGLRAGGFAQISVPIGGKKDAPVVPETAVRPSEKGFLAYVVEGDVAKERIVELGLRTSDGLVEIKTGINVGDKIVVHGAEALRDGAPVRVVEPGAPGSGGGTAGGSGSGPARGKP
jgi:membrane fusion protein (multidrug efflux system)/multidrug efflux system membrane fusion protein